MSQFVLLIDTIKAKKSLKKLHKNSNKVKIKKSTKNRKA